MCVYENGNFVTDHYYAIGDPFYSEISNYEATLKTDTQGIIATSGVSSESPNGEMRFVEINAERVRDFAVVIAKNGKILSETVGNTAVNYIFTEDSDCAASLRTAIGALKTFNECFGEYPYSSLNIVQTDLIYGGMEYPNLVYIDSRLKVNVKNYTIVHEIAHQWWYGVVGNNSVACAWLDEGLTEFSTALYYKLNGKETSFNNLIAAAQKRVNSFSAVAKVADIEFGRMDLSLNDFVSETAYTLIAYDKGMLFFNNIYEVMGERAFLSAISNYFFTKAYQNATPEDLLAAMEKKHRGITKIADRWITNEVLCFSC
jgi:aminopeptidase N